ncbi:MAG: penicillin-binding protein 1A [Neisseriales bacterium]|nr:MAG: penicillin-binding protein 1A [Neisseriales bacterium]
MFKKILAMLSGLMFGAGLLFAGCLTIAILIVYPQLPDLHVLTEYQPKIPLQIFSEDNQLIGEFGEEHRSFVNIQTVPSMMKNAILAAEDERFYQHNGIDYIGILRALFSNIMLGHTHSGASTITMQVARNFFLSREKTFIRKFHEVLLAFKIERSLTKNQILELYINQIYLGHRAYGFSAAARTYFGKPLDALSVAQMAMLAGLPKAPSLYNPITSMKRAKQRQHYVLDRMYELDFIDEITYQAALKEDVKPIRSPENTLLPGQYIAEMVRQIMYDYYGENAYTKGYRVYTTINSKHQKWAFDALRNGLMNFDHHFPYRGPISHIELSALSGSKEDQEAFLDQQLSQWLDDGDLQPGVVLSVRPSLVSVYLQGGQVVKVYGKGLAYAHSAIGTKVSAQRRICSGSVIYLRPHPGGYWEITQMPEVEGAFVSMDTKSGAIKALIGGFNFFRRNFNHVTQAWRQPGSIFKPFIYSAAIEKGMTVSTQVNDAPLSIPKAMSDGSAWEPNNSDGRFGGLMTLQDGLTRSRNLVSVRVLMAIGLDYSRQYIQRFGFDLQHHPASLSIALGAGSVTPLQMAEAYVVFANGGYRVKNYFIERIEDAKGQILLQRTPEGAVRTVDARNAYIMTHMLSDVMRHGTAASAMSLGRRDLGGKTGTTNDFKDSWFAGFNPDLVAVAWVGYDQPRSLGRLGFGGIAALPIWIRYMSDALKGQPNRALPKPLGIVTKGDGFYYQEYQQTNPKLHIDNRGVVPEEKLELDHTTDALNELLNNLNLAPELPASSLAEEIIPNTIEPPPQ